MNKLTINHHTYHSNNRNNWQKQKQKNSNNIYKTSDISSSVSNSRQVNTLNSTLNKSKIIEDHNNDKPIHFIQNYT